LGIILAYHATHVKIKIMDNHTEINSHNYSIRPSYQRHRRQRVWQVLLPVFAAILVMLGIGWLVIRSAAGTEAGGPVSQWADLSMIWLIIPVLVFAIAFTLLLGGMIYLLARLLKVLPRFTSQVQFYASEMAEQTAIWMNKLTSPMIAVESTKAGARRILSGIFGKHR
jgi:uncharacterized membrane protein SirB2